MISCSSPCRPNLQCIRDYLHAPYREYLQENFSQPPLYVINGNNWFQSLCHLLISPVCATLLKPAHMHIILSLLFLFSINPSRVIFLFFIFCCLLPSFLKSKWDLILNVVVCTVCVVSVVGKCVAAIIWQKYKAAPSKPLPLEIPHITSHVLLMNSKEKLQISRSKTFIQPELSLTVPLSPPPWFLT